jgi:hypothetical protein
MVPDRMYIKESAPTGNVRYRITPRWFGWFFGPRVTKEVEIKSPVFRTGLASLAVEIADLADNLAEDIDALEREFLVRLEVGRKTRMLSLRDGLVTTPILISPLWAKMKVAAVALGSTSFSTIATSPATKCSE